MLGGGNTKRGKKLPHCVRKPPLCFTTPFSSQLLAAGTANTRPGFIAHFWTKSEFEFIFFLAPFFAASVYLLTDSDLIRFENFFHCCVAIVYNELRLLFLFKRKFFWKQI